jgi:hypothetical protein
VYTEQAFGLLVTLLQATRRFVKRKTTPRLFTVVKSSDLANTGFVSAGRKLITLEQNCKLPGVLDVINFGMVSTLEKKNVPYYSDL